MPEEKGSKAMTLVAAADYELRFRKGLAPKGDWQFCDLSFLRSEVYSGHQENKKGEKELDIRPLIYDMYVNAGTVYFRLSAGSEANIKPELVMDAYLASIDVTPKPFAYEIHRRELYADLGKNGKRKLVPLGELGQDVASEQV